MSWPVVQERGLRRDDAVVVSSWAAEFIWLLTQRCPCGGRLERLEGEVVLAEPGQPVLPIPGQAFERCDAACVSCGRTRPLWFDVSLFWDDNQAFERFEELRRLFSEAVNLIEADKRDDARARMWEVAQREPWFGLAWFHLGMLALLDDDAEDAVEHLERAAGLMPLSPGVHQGLADAWSLLGERERARRHSELAESLEPLVDDGEE